MSIDVLSDGLEQKTNNFIDRNRKTLVIAEGVTSYFNYTEFNLFLDNINAFLGNFPNAEFFSSENINPPRSFIYRLLRFFVSLITRTKPRISFTSLEDFERFLNEKFPNRHNVYCKGNYVVYSLKSL
jgi:hypothetical protein